MRVHICAVGRVKTGPERDLIDDYMTRFDRTGRALGLGPLSMHEVEDRKGGGRAGEAARRFIKTVFGGFSSTYGLLPPCCREGLHQENGGSWF